jgi:hypothetical protein
MNRRRNTARDTAGRYDYSDMSLVCRCGHALGVHAAENPTRRRPCFNEDGPSLEGATGETCDCKNFRKEKP